VLITAVCGETSNGRRMGACQSISNDFAQATRHLDNQETGPAHNTLESVAKKINEAYTDGHSVRRNALSSPGTSRCCSGAPRRDESTGSVVTSRPSGA
jgi:hypothetical protein